jgi:heat-inducible transcriptional repressor
VANLQRQNKVAMPGTFGEKSARPAKGGSRPAESAAAGRSVAAAPSPEELLGERDREILKDIIHTYVTYGEPVSSRTVSKHIQHNLSAASIRNVMADLEEAGFLRQPHTSAGRVPTEAAYRLYVENLMTARQVSARDRRYIDEQIENAAGGGDDLMSRASQLLSELSNQVGVVLTPALEEILVKSLHFVPLGGHKILCVLVSDNNFIENVVVPWEEDLSPEELTRMSSYVTQTFGGQRLPEIRDRLLHLLSEDRHGLDQLLKRSMTLTQQAMRGSSLAPQVLVEGAAALIGQPELQDLDRVRRMLDMFADKTRLVRILSQCLALGGGVRVVLGRDSDVTLELDFSLVATTYHNGEKQLGSLGVLGPSRMEYPRILPLVRYLGDKVSRELAERSGAGAETKEPGRG